MNALAIDIIPAEGWGNFLPQPGSFTVAAFLMTVMFALRFTKIAGLDMRVTFWASLFGIIGALLGGWLWALCLKSDSFVKEVLRFDVLESDKSMFGALTGAAVASALYLELSRNSLLDYADTLVPALFIGYVVARLSCLLAGCCYGSPTDLPWGIAYVRGSEPFRSQVAAGLITPMASHSLKVHPVPIYHIMIGLFLYWVTRRARGKRGMPVVIALVGYGALRFFVEFLRGDALPLWHHLDMNHLASLLLFLAGSGFWILRVRRTIFPACAESR